MLHEEGAGACGPARGLLDDPHSSGWPTLPAVRAQGTEMLCRRRSAIASLLVLRQHLGQDDDRLPKLLHEPT
jgi:hypothetical protein